MKLREHILQLLSSPQYKPMTDIALGRAIGINKKQRGQLSHELRMLLAKGEVEIIKGDRFALPSAQETYRGRIQFRQTGWATVLTSGDDTPRLVHIPPEETGVALHGDTVEISLTKETRSRRTDQMELKGRVTKVLERGSDTVVGTLRKIRSSYYLQADDPRFVHEIVLPDPATFKRKSKPEPGDKVVVKIGEWTQRHRLIEGEILEVLGKTLEPDAELKGIYRKYDLTPEFPKTVLDEVRHLPGKIREEETTGRLDYRNVPTMTIDPDDAKDFDDALSLEELPNGGLKIGIHIADVANYVRPGTELDKEAQRRGNSTYLVGTVIPMLPEKLSNGLCSLVEAEDRLTQAVFLSFDQKSRLQHTEFGSCVIRSRKRLTYHQAYGILFENDLEKIRAIPLPPKHQTGSTGRALSSLSDLELLDLQNWIRKLWHIASKLRSERMKNGSLDLDMPETKVFVDEEGYADRLEKIEHDESHQLIEEFMLAANEAVARLTRTHRLPSIYRVHDKPDEEKLAELREFLGTFGIVTGDLSERAEIVGLLAKLAVHPQGYMLRTQLLRSLKKACYRATPDGHYGLNKRDYTHFTSPIRRYSDLVTHRVLEAYLIKSGVISEAAGKGRSTYSKAQMESMGEHLSLTETNSQEAERESVKIKLMEYFERDLSKKTRPRYEAVITEVRPHGLFVELKESMAFGFLPVANLNDDYYQLSKDETRLTGRKNKRNFAAGDTIQVSVHKVDRFKRMLDFELA